MYHILALAPLLFFGAVYAGQCDVSSAKLNPPFQHAANMSPEGVLLGMGTQNYICSSSGAYMSVSVALYFIYSLSRRVLASRYSGAMAQLYDVSCFVNDTIFSQMRKRDAPYANSDDVWYHEAAARAALGDVKPVGMLTYVSNTSGGSGMQPLFDFDSTYMHSNNTKMQATVVANATAPNSSQDITLQQMNSTDGSTTFYQVDTHYGRPPSTVNHFIYVFLTS